MARILVTLEPATLEELDRLAATEGTTRAEFITDTILDRIAHGEPLKLAGIVVQLASTVSEMLVIAEDTAHRLETMEERITALTGTPVSS